MKPIIYDGDDDQFAFCGLDNSFDKRGYVTISGKKDAIEKFFSCFSVDTVIALAKAGFYQKTKS